MSNNENLNLVKSKLYIDSMPDKAYFGFIEQGVDWNGWVCSWFTKEVVEEILTYLGYEWYYHSNNDTFEFRWPDDKEVEWLSGQNVLVDDTIEHLYPLGNRSWIWLEALEQ